MLFTHSWTGLCLLAGSLTGALARTGGLQEDPDIKAISVCCWREVVRIVTDRDTATDTQPRARKSPSISYRYIHTPVEAFLT